LTNPFWRVSISLGKSSKFVFDAPLDSLSTLSNPVVPGWPQPSWVRRLARFKMRARHWVQPFARWPLSLHPWHAPTRSGMPRSALAGCAASRGVRPWPDAAWPRCRMSAMLGWPAAVPCMEPSRGCPGLVDVAPPHPSASPTPSGSWACATAAAWRPSGPEPCVEARASTFLPR
jgi:hypothetical protein